MITKSRLLTSRRHIADRFIQQCSFGLQVKALPKDVKACGQFLGEKVSPQRGLHGTAAAIRVLAEDSRSEARALIPQLIRYVENRRTCEESDPAVDRKWLDNQLAHDDANVIKISDLLLGLAFVGGAVCGTEALRKDLADRLVKGKLDERGWGYFLHRPGGAPELLPTAHAVRALATHGYPVTPQVEYLLSALTKPSSTAAGMTRADISVRVFCLYVLCFTKHGQPLVPPDQLSETFSSAWRLESLLDDDIEQNIEYSSNGVNYYVRVPWQLYLLALACELAPIRAFASHLAQFRLESILRAVATKEGFLYPHSGEQVSSRTNAIVYDVLSVIDDRLSSKLPILFLPATALDRIRRALDSPVVRWPLYLGAVGLMGISVFSWYKEASVKDLAPNFLVWLILLVLTARKPR